MSEIYLSPSEIRFCHDNISPSFSNGRQLVDVFKDLLYGNLDVEDMRPIHVVLRWGDYYAVQGNRRLKLFKILESIDEIDEIMVLKKDLIEHIFDKKYTTDNDGDSVTCDKDPYLDDDINDVIQEWKADEGDETDSSTESYYSETESESDSDDGYYHNRWSSWR